MSKLNYRYMPKTAVVKNRKTPGVKPRYGSGPMTKHSVLPVPEFLHDAATDAAWRARLSRCEWIRRAMLAALEAEGKKT